MIYVLGGGGFVGQAYVRVLEQRGLPVTAAAVSRAAAELHVFLAEPIDAVIGAAREQRAARVAALEAELEQARKAVLEME